MSITRHEIRKLSDDTRGQPVISQAVVHGGVAYFAGVTPDPIVGDIKIQTVQVLRRVDELLRLAGTDKSHLLSVQAWLADMRLFEEHNAVWNQDRVPAEAPPSLVPRIVRKRSLGDYARCRENQVLRPQRRSGLGLQRRHQQDRSLRQAAKTATIHPRFRVHPGNRGYSYLN